ncbi:hypothetical protein [Desulfovibrio inopinatus]|uniref:hypothetical protein n=1 Tax=Desulfovibrio inopinatus TaxID=102109 RepID=UPI0003FD5E15|nr:hypothetical protein [Desulfovibrio inopinatus]
MKKIGMLLVMGLFLFGATAAHADWWKCTVNGVSANNGESVYSAKMVCTRISPNDGAEDQAWLNTTSKDQYALLLTALASGKQVQIRGASDLVDNQDLSAATLVN